MSNDEPPTAVGVPVAGMPTRSGSVARTLLLAALVSTVVLGLGFQFGTGDTVFDRPGELVLLFVDIAPLLWFTSAAILLSTLRWQPIDQRFRWVLLAAIAAIVVAVVVRVLVFANELVATVLEPFTLAFLAAVVGAVIFTRARVRRLARGTDAGVTLVGLATGFCVAGIGVAVGALNLALVAPEGLGPASRAMESSPTTGLLIGATLAMVGGLFWLTDRTRNPGVEKA